VRDDGACCPSCLGVGAAADHIRDEVVDESERGDLQGGTGIEGEEILADLGEVLAALEGEVGEVVGGEVVEELGLEDLVEELGEAGCRADGDEAVSLHWGWCDWWHGDGIAGQIGCV
jgi:hypothetical protein